MLFHEAFHRSRFLIGVYILGLLRWFVDVSDTFAASGLDLVILMLVTRAVQDGVTRRWVEDDLSTRRLVGILPTTTIVLAFIQVIVVASRMASR